MTVLFMSVFLADVLQFSLAVRIVSGVHLFIVCSVFLWVSVALQSPFPGNRGDGALQSIFEALEVWHVQKFPCLRFRVVF